jgi:hypothetical protein
MIDQPQNTARETLAYDGRNGARMIFTNPFRIALLLFLSLAVTAQAPLDRPVPTPEPPGDIRLPNGKLQRDEILKADYQKTLDDARALSKLTDELKRDLEKSDYNVLSVGTLKKIDDIDRLAKRIRDRLRRN